MSLSRHLFLEQTAAYETHLSHVELACASLTAKLKCTGEIETIINYVTWLLCNYLDVHVEEEVMAQLSWIVFFSKETG